MYKYECIIRQYKNDRKSTIMINEGIFGIKRLFNGI